jgi:hypothetical protein
VVIAAGLGLVLAKTHVTFANMGGLNQHSFFRQKCAMSALRGRRLPGILLKALGEAGRG